MFDNFIKYCLSHGGRIMPIEIPSEETSHLGICNPSIFIEDNGTIRLILRNVNYALWNSDNEYKFTSVYGPLYYITPDDDLHLRTSNFLCKLTDNGIDYKLIDTSANDWASQWEFVGQEDMRLVRWNGKLYGTGVQRDWNTTGIGRMHLSELDENTGKELSRVRIQTPGNVESYCEKNWMPILDMPYHYVRSCNPTEVVKVNPETGECETVVYKVPDSNIEYLNTDNMQIRGSSQVIPYGEYRIAIVHLCQLWFNEKQQKSGTGYYEQFIIWDKDWNIVKMSEPFNFAKYGVEFTNGIAYREGIFYIPFALQDNTAFMVTINDSIISKFIFEDNSELGDYNVDNDILLYYFSDTTNSVINVIQGNKYFESGHYASAMVFYERACEYNTFNNNESLYGAMFMVGKCLAVLGSRDAAEEDLWLRLVNLNPGRSEGYVMLAKYYSWREMWNKAFTFAKLGVAMNNYKYVSPYCEVTGEADAMIEYLKAKYNTEDYLSVEDELNKMKIRYSLNEGQIYQIDNMINIINNNKTNKYRVL